MTPRIVKLDRYARPQPFPEAVPVHGSQAVGVGLLTTGPRLDDVEARDMGADVLWLPAGASFPVHAHPGNHVLHVLSGRGTISLDGETFDTEPGDLYLVPGDVPHAVGAGPFSAHVILAVGSPHMPIDSPARMTVVDWEGREVEVPILPDGSPWSP